MDFAVCVCYLQFMLHSIQLLIHTHSVLLIGKCVQKNSHFQNESLMA